MSENRYLMWYDYVVFGILLAASAAIGIYFAIAARMRKNVTTADYLLGGQDMSVWPVALSLLASFMSAITLLGTPSEIYTFGLMYIWIGLSYVFVMLVSNYIYIPVFFRLRLSTSYQYLGVRFHRSVQILGSISFILQMVTYMGIVLYAPSLALNAVTGLNVWISVACVGLVATFYTTIGGIKAVVWTDAFQVFVMFAGLLAILIKGTLNLGGVMSVWDQNVLGGRTSLVDFNPDPTVRHTIWTQVIGNTFVWLSIYGINQTMVQRCLTLPTVRQARWAYWLNTPGLIFLMLFCSACGLVIFAAYAQCDPVRSGEISKNDQLLPLFVMEFMTDIPGLAGVFVSSLFSGALSTVSSGINSLASVTLHDILPGLAYVKNLSEYEKTRVCKIIAGVYGLLSLVMALLASQLGQVLQAALGLFGMLGGPMLGLFTLGMLFPSANWKGALIGHLTSQAVTFWMGFGYYVYGVQNPTLPTSVVGCENMRNYTINATVLPPESNGQDSIHGFYKVSYTWYSLYGFLMTVIIGLLSSLIFDLAEAKNASNCQNVDPDLLTPFLRNIIKSRNKSFNAQKPESDCSKQGNGFTNNAFCSSDTNEKTASALVYQSAAECDETTML